MSKSPLLVDSWIRNLAGKNLEISISLDRSSIHIDPQQKHLKPGCTIFLLIDNSLIKFNPQYFKIAESLTTSNNPIESALMWLNIPNYILVLRISLDIYICMPIFYHIWNILVYETYLKHIWNIYETYMKHIWNISETYKHGISPSISLCLSLPPLCAPLASPRPPVRRSLLALARSQRAAEHGRRRYASHVAPARAETAERWDPWSSHLKSGE